MRLPAQSKGLDRWFFKWEWHPSNTFPDSESGNGNISPGNRDSGYFASYVIGAQWLDRAQTEPLVVTPKRGCEKLDFLQMFAVCLQNGLASQSFSSIYNIDLDKPKIRCPELNSILSPLVVFHFISLVQDITRKGLRKGYVERTSNLNKIKGHIDIPRNERRNIIPRRFDRVACRYQEYSEDTLENRLIKKALRFCCSIISLSDKLSEKVQNVLNRCLSAFANVGDEIEQHEVRLIKHNKLFKEYNTAIRLAHLILRRYDYSIANIPHAEENDCPIFWIDMSMLFEHYVLGLLHEAYGGRIKYQQRGHTGYPDFICHEPLMVLDAKYIPRFANDSLDPYIARQLSGYSRDKLLFPVKPEGEIPCVVIFPQIEGNQQGVGLANPFLEIPLEKLPDTEDPHLHRFHTVAVPLPSIKEQ